MMSTCGQRAKNPLFRSDDLITTPAARSYSSPCFSASNDTNACSGLVSFSANRRFEHCKRLVGLGFVESNSFIAAANGALCGMTKHIRMIPDVLSRSRRLLIRNDLILRRIYSKIRLRLPSMFCIPG